MSVVKNSIVMKKGVQMICFDIVIPTKHGTLYCVYFNHKSELHSGTLGGAYKSFTTEHALLGDVNEPNYLGCDIKINVLKPRKSCTNRKFN